MTTIKLARAKTARQIIEKKRNKLAFEGEWSKAFGNPVPGFFGIMWGKSFSGKTNFMVKFLKYLCGVFGEVIYNSLEEGDVDTFAQTLRAAGLGEEQNFKVVSEPWSHLVYRLLRRKSARFAIVDSLQYAGISYKQYCEDKEKLRKKGKTIIFISHAEGNHPESKTAKKIRYDVDLKIQVIGFVAMIEMRGNGRYPLVIWEEGARKYWGKKYSSVIAGKYWPGDKK